MRQLGIGFSIKMIFCNIPNPDVNDKQELSRFFDLDVGAA